jgi:hypothetical protein
MLDKNYQQQSVFCVQFFEHHPFFPVHPGSKTISAHHASQITNDLRQMQAQVWQTQLRRRSALRETKQPTFTTPPSAMNYRAVGCLLLLAIVGGSSGLNFLKSSFVTTQFGALVGDTRVKGAFAFLGVPYAQPPLKSLRFARTAPWSQSWSGNRTATTVRIKPFCLGNVIFGNRSLTQNLVTLSTTLFAYLTISLFA